MKCKSIHALSLSERQQSSTVLGKHHTVKSAFTKRFILLVLSVNTAAIQNYILLKSIIFWQNK